jgi:NAD(P)-dependent dehydrogenase (short-subunit alcohol dehydrogenase family)
VSKADATLNGTIAVVTGASRGAGRGIARVLGQRGATVYVTGRTTGEHRSDADFAHTIEETAAEVDDAGGHGIAIRCDHTDDAAVEQLFARVRDEHDKLDVLVCNAWGGYMPYDEHNDWWSVPFWEQSMARWDGMFTAGLRAHISSCRYGLPLMLAAGQGLVVLTTFTRGRRYLGNVFYDVAKNAVCRLAAGLAADLGDREIAVIALSPGWMAVERMPDDAHSRAQMESPEYIGRAVAALAEDPGVARRTGQAFAVGDLARMYGFNDIDGRQPTSYPIEP